MSERIEVGDRVVMDDDAGGPVYRVLSVSPSGICRLRHEEGGFDTPPVDVSHLRVLGWHETTRREATGG